MEIHAWKRSSYCAGGGNNCVEVAVCGDGQIALRDSAFPARAVRVNRSAFAALIAEVREPGADGAGTPL
ncbi:MULTISPECIES: DUF397 domain-containing protein [unclassified Streptomyces]|uniref:DUF397 domain-containing protein n=1 Tax=unclassified Streptomyces TaxID=2593676 RepID=UPI0022B5F823|nr:MULTISPECIES: DUF397 domain-containing protein [unclassified Streptomyces]MCZ7415027.1 DUF397 domain-containing protein [Streptomyces sp. WMMC897]MCZ7431970.1 DUF397 domain-containing protein [Streptomyces sp. WMMC1477]